MSQLGIRIINIALFALSCLIVANTVNSVIERQQAPDPFANTMQTAREIPPKPTWEERKTILDRNLFGARVAGAPAKKAAPPLPPVETVVETKLPLELLGTMAATPESLSSAVIQNTRLRKHEVVGIGDTLENHDSVEVLAIEPRRVLLKNGNRREELVLAENKPSAKPRSSSKSNDAASKRKIRRPSRKSNRQARPSRLRAPPSAPPAELSEAATDILARTAQNLLTSATMLPRFDVTGEVDGFTINQMKPDSAFKKMGIENEDVITSVNGIPLDSQESSLKILGEFGQCEGEITLTIERAGEPSEITKPCEILSQLQES